MLRVRIPTSFGVDVEYWVCAECRMTLTSVYQKWYGYSSKETFDAGKQPMVSREITFDPTEENAFNLRHPSVLAAARKSIKDRVEEFADATDID